MDADATRRSVIVIAAEAVVTGGGVVGDAIGVDGGVIVAVGDRSQLLTAGATLIDHPGGYLMPGFRDAHLHAVPYAALLAGCSLKNASSIDDLIARLSAHASRVSDEKPVVATRFDDEHLAERRLPTRDDLDRAVPDRPAVIYRYCGHVAVANSAALAASGIGAAAADPPGGSIDRGADGRPTGVLRETAAGLIAPALARGGALEPGALIHGLHRLADLGITSVGAMMGYGEQPSERLEAEIDLWRSVAADLPVRVAGITITDDPELLRHAAESLNSAGERLRWLGVKRFADGSLGGHTASMTTPFSDQETTGTYRLTDADERIAREALGLGGMVAIHAIGDQAIDGVLDLYERLMSDGASAGSLRIEHASIMRPDQIARCASMGVTACVQPAFLASEADWVADRVGGDRIGWIYPFRSMRDAGIPLAGSSDCPVEPPHPVWGMAAAVDRHGISEAEALRPSEALDLFTSGSAAALRELPPLGVGAPADVVVVDRNITTASAESIHDTAILATYVGGVAIEREPDQPSWVD